MTKKYSGRNRTKKNSQFTTLKKRISKTRENKTKRYRKNKSNRRRFKMRGGGVKVFGRGAFGLVVGEPRLKCVGDTDNDNILMNQVSKLFDDESEAEKEYAVIERLGAVFNDNDTMKLLKKYAVLPEKKCGIYNESINQYEIYALGVTSAMLQTSQIVYPKGENDLESEPVTNFGDFVNFIKATIEHNAGINSGNGCSIKVIPAKKVTKVATSGCRHP